MHCAGSFQPLSKPIVQDECHLHSNILLIHRFIYKAIPRMQIPDILTDLIRRICNVATAEYQKREVLSESTPLRESRGYFMFLSHPGMVDSNNVQTCNVTNDQ
jgi:hypothetical protein